MYCSTVVTVVLLYIGVPKKIPLFMNMVIIQFAQTATSNIVFCINYFGGFGLNV